MSDFWDCLKKLGFHFQCTERLKFFSWRPETFAQKKQKEKKKKLLQGDHEGDFCDRTENTQKPFHDLGTGQCCKKKDQQNMILFLTQGVSLHQRDDFNPKVIALDEEGLLVQVRQLEFSI